MFQLHRLKNSALALLVVLSSSVFAADEASSSGDCTNFKMPIQAELSLWDKAQIRVQSAQDSRSTAILPVAKRINLALHQQNRVELILKPEKPLLKGVLAYAGLATLDVKKDGLYRVSAGSKVWIDVIEAASSEAIKPARTEMQTGCLKIFKVVEYNLKAGVKYYLQISAATTPGVDLLTGPASQP